ncbi:MAG TPA: tRNA epoxyqueuosine(34) reductase QueG [Acidimicrobiales bacterium]
MPLAAVRRRQVPDGAELAAVGREAGLDRVGITAAQPFATTRAHLERRRTAGLSDSMAFTYRRPERSTDPAGALRNARSLVVGARSYRRTVGREAGLDVPAGRAAGRVARYAWQDHYAALRDALGAVAERLRADGWRARVLADDNALVDREAAYRAGIGWYGKNANLLVPGEGSWFVLGSVVTDAPLEPTGRRVPDGCGGCSRCIESCPTGAIVAPGVVDARRCLAWLLQVEGPFPREHRVALGDRLYGCDDCQTSCPINLRAERAGPVPPPAAADAQVVVDILDLLGRSDQDLMARHGRWYVPRRQARYLRRNALVVLGNTAAPDSVAAVGALRRALRHEDPLVRGHAVWAARRLGRDDLLGAVAADADPFVREELHAPVKPRGSDPAHPAPRPVDVPIR